MARWRPIDRHRRRQNLWAFLAGGAALLVLLSLAILMWFARGVPVDDRNCPVSGPVSRDLVLVDATDSFTDVQKLGIRRQLTRIRNEVPAGGLLALYAIADQTSPSGRLAPLVELCNPGDGSKANPLIANPGLQRRRWQEEFQSKLEGQFRMFLESEGAATSPIMESLQKIALTVDLESRTPSATRLWIVSDLVEHTETYSHFRQDPSDWEDYLASPAAAHRRAPFDGASVYLYYVRRDNARSIQGQSHVRFWERWFSENGAMVELVEWIEG